MSERYIKVFSGDPNLYTENAPVVIQASALLKDTETGKMIAQLKFQNISGKVISYVKATITQLDAVSNPLGDAMAFEYLDLSAADKDDFGSKKPLPLPNASTRAFRVGVSTVGFADGSAWTGDKTDWKAEAEDSAISKIIAVEATYKKALALSKSKKVEDIKQAKEILESIQADKDVTMEISLCNDQIAATDAKDTAKKKKAKLSVLLGGGVVLLALLGYFVAYPLIAYWSGNYSVCINMYNIKNFKIPYGVTEIKPNAFANFDTLESVTIPDSVTSIGERAFIACKNLTSVTIPDSVTTIGYSAFSACSNLSTVTIGNGVTSISDCTFLYCDNLTSVTIPNSVSTIGRSAFQQCDKLTSIVIPDSVTSIGDRAFQGCTSLTSIVIPDSVTSIGEGAFFCCSSLTSIVIPNGVTSIEYATFNDCSSLTSIEIPVSVTKIGVYAFHLCSDLAEIHYNGTKEQWKAIDKDSSWNLLAGEYTIYCTDGELSKYS